MFTIVDASNRELNANLLDALYRARYDAFVVGRGWSDLERPDGRDIDQFDDEETVYIIGHEDLSVFAACRIRPSEKPHLLQSAFSHLVDGPVPTGEKIFECSRLLVQRRHPNRMRLFVELLSVTVDWYRAQGSTLLTGVIENWWVNSFLSLDFKISPLGKPDRVGRNAIVAVQVIIDEDLQAGLHQRLVEAMTTEPPLAPAQSREYPDRDERAA